MEVMQLFLLALPIFLLIVLKLRNNGKALPPGPPGLPLIGHLHILKSADSLPHVFLYKLSKKYGSVMSLRFGFQPVLVISSAKMAEEVMKTHDLDFCSRPTSRCGRRLSYDGADVALSPYSSYWREIRKICVVHLFNSNRVQHYRPIREDEVARLTSKISKLSLDSQPVNLSEAITSLTSTIICRVGFGKRYEEDGTERSRFHGLLTECQDLLSLLSVADFFPFLGWVDKFSGIATRLEKCFHELDDFYKQIIDEHLHPNRPKPEQDDLVDVLLHLQKGRNLAIDLTMNNIKAILMDVFTAGTDTVAVGIVWIMTYLMKNPRCMKKVQDEVRNLIGKKDFVNEDDVKGLPYLQAVIKETLRLQPVTPLLSRKTIRKCKLSNYEIPADTMVFVNALAIGRDPEVWEKPEEFYPERFIGSSIDFKGMDFELIPFGSGRRSCPGIHMGVATVELTIANLAYKFDWELPTGMNKDDIDFGMLPGLAVHKKDPLCLLARKIN